MKCILLCVRTFNYMYSIWSILCCKILFLVYSILIWRKQWNKYVLCFQLTQYISDLGGVFGLWIGASVLTLCEFLDLLITLAAFSFYQRNSKKYKTHKRIFKESQKFSSKPNKVVFPHLEAPVNLQNSVKTPGNTRLGSDQFGFSGQQSSSLSRSRSFNDLTGFPTFQY